METHNRAAFPRWLCLTVLGIALSAAFGCLHGSGPGPADRTVAEDIPILWQMNGTYSRLTQPLRLVVRDQATLAQIPLTDIPVDFRTEMVVIAGLGPTVTNELGITIARVWQQGSAIQVQERRIHPGLQEDTRIQPASPWAVAIIPRSDLNVEGYAARVPRNVLGDHLGAR